MVVSGVAGRAGLAGILAVDSPVMAGILLMPGRFVGGGLVNDEVLTLGMSVLGVVVLGVSTVGGTMLGFGFMGR
jgi:hypothetical protein